MAAKKAKKSLSPMQVGNTVCIRTATHTDVGTLVEINQRGVVLSPACWIADTARWAEFCATGATLEHEPFAHPVEVPFGGMIDVTLWPHAVPTSAK